MTQLLLFDAPKHRARKRDPETSHIAATEIEPKLNQVQERFVAALKHVQPATSQEVALQANQMFGGCPETYRKRAGELIASEVIEVCDKRTCKVTGKLAQVYRVAGGGK